MIQLFKKTIFILSSLWAVSFSTVVVANQTDPSAITQEERINSDLLTILTRMTNTTPYSFDQLVYLYRYGINLQNLSKTHEFPHHRELAFAYLLGRSGGHMDWETNTSKPKALIIASEADPNEAFAPYTEYVNFFRELDKHYNVRYRVVANPTEFCQAINDAANEGSIELLIVGGHGSRSTIRLGENSRLFSNVPLPDENCLKKLAPHATIYLESCATGNGREYTFNMANYFAKHAPGRKVIAPQFPVTIQDEKLFFDPFFDIALTDKKGQDISYRIDPEMNTQRNQTITILAFLQILPELRK